VTRQPGIPHRLHKAIELVIGRFLDFNEWKQETWCRVCRYKGKALHDPDCPIYELHCAWDEALSPAAREAQSADSDSLVNDGEIQNSSDEP
jgi:hypothetical protein